MELSYQKNENSKLFASLVKPEIMDISTIQNYIPIYSTFFALQKNNYNSINLKHHYYLYNITKKQSENIFQGKVKDEYGNTHTKDIFIKYSPLLDPVKYMIGKYDNSNNELFNLPTFIDNNAHEKMRDTNNTAYIDSFFSFLSSQLLHHHGFIHGVDFYGSYISIKNNFMANVCDDIDYLSQSSYFKKNIGNLFTMEYEFQINSSDTRTFKEPLKFTELDTNTIQLADIHDLDELDKILIENANANNATGEEHIDVVYEYEGKNNNIDKLSSSSGSTCSSRSSNTENTNERENDAVSDNDNDTVSDNDSNIVSDNDAVRENDDVRENDSNSDNDSNSVSDNDAVSDSDSSYSDSDSDSDGDDTVMATIKTFPVQIIALEKCESTLDDLMTHNKLSEDEWGSIVIQILMSLITFQKTFHLTHNDLHTNNVMYINTDIKELYYKINEKYYKVPTFGRIFKIIDFGRAIYKYRNTTICSDSFNHNGDASTQYNCEPYFNPKKPILEPNPSFDLCRLGCSLYDVIVDEYKNYESSPILKIIINWCMDDKKRNVLYKKDGEERYPDFKLYKMIARTVHSHVPINVLQNEYFEKYTFTYKKSKKNTINIMDIDAIPCYI
jgi:hypothetical protein